jgi:tetratricopeptide (TPR) repeat protein
MRSALRWLVFVASFGTSGVAFAADQSPRGLELFEKSSAAYEQGRFTEAIWLLKEAYAIDKEPVLLYNLGRAYEGLGDLKNAAGAYEQFLAAEPRAADRGALEQRIRTLRRQLAEREALAARAARRERDGAAPSAVPWIVAGTGAATLVAGGVMGLLSSNRHDRAVDEPTHVEAERLQTESDSFATAANVCFIAGGAVLAIGVIWGILDVTSSKSSTASAGQVVRF